MIDMKEQYGKKYKVTLDESWTAEKDKKAEDRIWYDEIHGRKGWAYIQNPSTLAVEIKRSQWSKFKALAPFPYTVKRLFGESTKILVNEEHIDKALCFIVPRKRRQLTDEQKAQLSARLAKFRFKPAVG